MLLLYLHLVVDFSLCHTLSLSLSFSLSLSHTLSLSISLGIGLSNIYVNEALRRICTQSDELVM